MIPRSSPPPQSNATRPSDRNTKDDDCLSGSKRTAGLLRTFSLHRHYALLAIPTRRLYLCMIWTESSEPSRISYCRHATNPILHTGNHGNRSISDTEGLPSPHDNIRNTNGAAPCGAVGSGISHRLVSVIAIRSIPQADVYHRIPLRQDGDHHHRYS